MLRKQNILSSTAGVVRMTISITVILVEAIGDIAFGLPLMVVILISKLVGDYFNEV